MQVAIGALVLVLIVVAVVAAVVTQSGGSTKNVRGVTTPGAYAVGSSTVPIGTKMPDFNLATIDGKHYTMSSARGSATVIEYFAVWCPVCQGMAPTMASIYHDFSPQGVKQFSILASPYGPNFDTSNQTDLTPATTADVAYFIKHYGVTEPVLVDPSYSYVNKTMGTGGYPTIYVLDAKGIVRYEHAGAVTYATLADAINKANA
jgi:peroxiredoxin